MAFVKKDNGNGWKDRISDYPNRRTLTNVNTGEAIAYDVTRNEGQVAQQGDVFSAANMNDLENRIAEAFNTESGKDNIINVSLSTGSWLGPITVNARSWYYYQVNVAEVISDNVMVKQQSVPPTQAMETAFKLIKYVTFDKDLHWVRLYAQTKPTSNVDVSIIGVTMQ